MAALRAAILSLGFAFVLTQSTAAIKPSLGLVFNSQKCCHTFVNCKPNSVRVLKTNNGYAIVCFGITYDYLKVKKLLLQLAHREYFQFLTYHHAAQATA